MLLEEQRPEDSELERGRSEVVPLVTLQHWCRMTREGRLDEIPAGLRRWNRMESTVIGI